MRSQVDVLRLLARTGGVRVWHYALPVGLMMIAAALEGASMGLLFPVAKGLAAGGFQGVWDMAGFRTVAEYWPEWVATFSSSNRRTFLFLIVLAFGMSISGAALGLLAGRIAAWRNGLYTAQIKAQTMARCLSFGKQHFDRSSLSSVIEALGFANVLPGLLSAAESATASALRLAAHVVVLVAISWRMTLFLALAFPVLRAIDRALVRRSAAASREALETQQQIAREVFNVVSTIPLVKTLAIEAEARRRFNALAERMRVSALERSVDLLTASPLQQIVTLTALLVVVSVAVALTQTGSTAELTVMCAFLLVVRRSIPTLSFATNLRLSFSQAWPSLERLADVFNDANKYFVASGPREFTGPRDAITISNLTFGYTDDQPVLRHLSCTFPAGRTTAIVGETGCGKTTVANLVARLYECPPGTIRCDGVDIREFSRESLARRLAYVGQDAWLFNDTLRANLVIGLDRQVTDDELLDVLNRVRLGATVARLPKGLDSSIGDRGVTLSGGERQRLCVTRGLLRRADIVVLDEATSALDSQTEQDVLQAIADLTRGATVITIAHRLSTVQAADQIIVMARGAVLEVGSWEDLIEAGGAFAALWEIQSRSARAQAV